MNNLTHVSLFSGIGGLDLAAEAAGFETVCQCEWADFPHSVLSARWPDVPRFRDITTFTKEAFLKKQDLKQLPLSQAAFPVSPSPPPENGRALRMNATCGRKCAALLPSCGPVGCLGKMLLASSIWGSTKRSLTWQKRDTLFSHSYFRLAVSAHGMSASELFIVAADVSHTPCLRQQHRQGRGKPGCVPVGQWDIPQEEPKRAIWSLSLSAAVFYLTPVASDGFRSTLKPSAFDPAKKDGNLSAQIISQERPVSETAALNPDWVEWLMGFPKGWTDVSSGPPNRKESSA